MSNVGGLAPTVKEKALEYRNLVKVRFILVIFCSHLQIVNDSMKSWKIAVPFQMGRRPLYDFIPNNDYSGLDNTYLSYFDQM